MLPGSFSVFIEVVGLLTMQVRLSYATARVETSCDGREDGAQCYGPMGGTVFIQLIENASEIYKYEIKHTKSIILSGRKNTTLKSIHNRYFFNSSNGTFSISNLSLTDSGEYILESFDSNGKRKEQRTIELSLEAPVSSVQLVSECLSQGQVKVSCLSEGGDSLQYKLTLGGHTLKDSELLSINNQTNVIVLKQNISGYVVCSVWNKVSNVFKEKYTSTCDFVNCTFNGVHISKWVFKEDSTLCDEPLVQKHNIIELLPIIIGSISALGVLLIVLVISMGIICARRKKAKDKEEEDNRELAYASLRRRQQEQSRGTQVKYGKVKKQPRQFNVTLYGFEDNSVYGNVEDSVYANI